MSGERYKSARKDGHNGETRRIGQRSRETRDSKFDAVGDEVDRETDAVLWDRYFETDPGTGQARRALNVLMKVSQ